MEGVSKCFAAIIKCHIGFKCTVCTDLKFTHSISCMSSSETQQNVTLLSPFNNLCIFLTTGLYVDPCCISEEKHFMFHLFMKTVCTVHSSAQKRETWIEHLAVCSTPFQFCSSRALLVFLFFLFFVSRVVLMETTHKKAFLKLN